jgi:hypothetical protein
MAANRVFRSANENPRVISDRIVSGALLPCTAVFVGATSLTQATAVSGGRLALLGNRDFYGTSASGFTATDPMMTAYTSGETGLAYLLEPQNEVVWAMAAGTYTNGQELTVAASGRLAAAATGNIVVAHFDQAGGTLAAGDLADVCITNFYSKA